MKREFPKLPEYEFTWRSIQVEPIPFSGERITLGIIVKGCDRSFIAVKLIDSLKLRQIFNEKFGRNLADALALCISAAEDFYSNKPLFSNWQPPLEGFHLSKLRSSLAINFEDALFHAAMHCSSFSASAEIEKQGTKKNTHSAPEIWRRNILKAVTSERADFAPYFERSVTIRGSGVPISFGFLSGNYAAQFDALSEGGGIQPVLVRAQSKLWQLDRLRDEGTLFKPEYCELLIKIPSPEGRNSAMGEFVEELKYEASRRELKVFTCDSPLIAARHLIEKAA